MLIWVGLAGLSPFFPRITGRPLAKCPSGMSGAEVAEKNASISGLDEALQVILAVSSLLFVFPSKPMHWQCNDFTPENHPIVPTCLMGRDVYLGNDLHSTDNCAVVSFCHATFWLLGLGLLEQSTSFVGSWFDVVVGTESINVPNSFVCVRFPHCSGLYDR